ncbi:MAG TPA: hypothetical protein PKH09_03550 [Parvularculaceae bacterium]|nr:hypothetical protein [Parvularculaceae bacterium]
MCDLRRLTENSSIARALGAALAAAVLAGGQARAATATFDSSMPYAPGPMTTLSTAGDGLGQLVPLGEWISLLFAQPFGVSRSDTVSIFTLAPPTGNARLTISFGRYNGGSPVFADTRSVNAGNTLTVNNLFQRGCSALGGCDFIFITTTRQRGGAPGATVDYVSVNGETTEVTAPTPDLSVWSMMVLGFAGVAWRMKTRKAYSFSSA